jgi:hypothetical protein
MYHPIITILALLAGALLVTALPSNNPLVSLNLYPTSSSCVNPTPYSTLALAANRCYTLHGAQGLSVAAHDGELRYNACKWIES